MRPSSPGLVVALEGIDGTGKTSVAAALGRHLGRAGLPVSHWKEPRDAYLAALAQDATSGGRWEEAALAFTLDRALSQPDLALLVAAGRLVLSDRSLYSTLAYQVPFLDRPAGQRVTGWQRRLSNPPDLVLWLRLPVKEALARLARRPGRKTPWEGTDVLKRAHRAYARLARRLPQTIRIVDASPGLEAVVLAAARPIEEAWRSRQGGPAP
jgi:dTMP kinase